MTWKSLLALVIIAIGIGVLVPVVQVVLYPSTIEEGSIAYKNIKPHTEEQVSIQEEEMEVIGRYCPSGVGITKIHDNKDNVTCWIYRGGQRGGISCIPDHMLSP